MHGQGPEAATTPAADEVSAILEELNSCSPELALVVAEFRGELLAGSRGFQGDAAWWTHLEVRFALRCLLRRLEESLESFALRFDDRASGAASQLQKLQLLTRLVSAFEATTEPRLANSAQPPLGLKVERRYGLKPSEAEILRLLVVREAATSRGLCQYLALQEEISGAVSALCRASRLELHEFLQEKRPYITEGVVRIQDGGYGDSKEPTVSPEAVQALLGRELTTEQRLKLSSTAIEAVFSSEDSISEQGDCLEEPSAEGLALDLTVADAAAEEDEDRGTAEEATGHHEWTGGTEDVEQPYRESLDYLNDQFSLLECEIRIAEHRRQATKEDAGVDEPSFMRSRKVNVFEYEAKRKLALARISHRLALTSAAGLEVPRLEALIQKKKLDNFEKSVVVMLIGQTLSPKIQATLSVGERRFCRDAPLQVRVILETFCRDFKEEVQKRVHFYKSSRLAGSGIIRIGAGARSADLTYHTVHIDRRILDYVVGLDTEINEVVEGSNLYKPTATLEQLVLPTDMKQNILDLVCNFDQFCRYRKSSGLEDAIAHGAGL
ncbi:unnamed protein product, partial [Polarella glacialis]